MPMGNTIILTCFSATTPKWTREGFITNYALEDKIFIPKAQREHTGNFTCSGTKLTGIKFKVNAYIKVVQSKHRTFEKSFSK